MMKTNQQTSQLFLSTNNSGQAKHQNDGTPSKIHIALIGSYPTPAGLACELLHSSSREIITVSFSSIEAFLVDFSLTTSKVHAVVFCLDAPQLVENAAPCK